jgi:hypothetical protein
MTALGKSCPIEREIIGASNTQGFGKGVGYVEAVLR